MSQYTPEQIDSLLDGAKGRPLTVGERAELFMIARAYAATLRQQAARVDEGVSGLCQRNPAPNAAQPMAATSPTVRLEAALSAQPAERQGEDSLYVEARQCEDCDHLGMNDCSDTHSACGDCEWQGPTPDEDKCPGCGHENCMAVACPECGGRYRFLADRRLTHAAAPVGVPDGMVLREVVEVAQGDLHMLKKAIEARDPWPELLFRVTDTERDLRTALAAAPSAPQGVER